MFLKELRPTPGSLTLPVIKFKIWCSQYWRECLPTQGRKRSLVRSSETTRFWTRTTATHKALVQLDEWNLSWAIFFFSFVGSGVDSFHRIKYWKVPYIVTVFLCRRRQCVEAGFHLTYISFARLILLKMAQNPWCSESSTRWVSSTSGKSSVRKGIRESLKQTKKIALQIREKEKYEESRFRRFKQAWNEEFPWVKFDEIKNYMFCAVCQKHPSVCDKSSSFFGVLTVHHLPVFVVTP